jgi:hypothetical protein
VDVKLLRVVCKYFLGPNMVKFLWQYLQILLKDLQTDNLDKSNRHDFED